jgi:hypothetical protein
VNDIESNHEPIIEIVYDESVQADRLSTGELRHLSAFLSQLLAELAALAQRDHKE